METRFHSCLSNIDRKNVWSGSCLTSLMRIHALISNSEGESREVWATLRSLFSKKTTFKASVTLAWRLVTTGNHSNHCLLQKNEHWQVVVGCCLLSLDEIGLTDVHRTAHKTSLRSLLLWADFRCSACHLSANSLTQTTNGGRWSSSQTFYFKVTIKKYFYSVSFFLFCLKYFNIKLNSVKCLHGFQGCPY